MFQIYFDKYQAISKSSKKGFAREAVKNLGICFIVELIVLMIVLIAYVATESLRMYKVGACLAVIAIIFMIILEITPKHNSHQDLKDRGVSALSTRIEDFERFLKVRNMYDKASIQLLIKLCSIELEKEKTRTSLSTESFFIVLILAIIQGVSGIVIEGVDTGIILNLAVASILILMFMLIVSSAAMSDLASLIYRKKYSLEAFGEDLEYILYRYEKKLSGTSDLTSDGSSEVIHHKDQVSQS